jgi:hypothetical protein
MTMPELWEKPSTPADLIKRLGYKRQSANIQPFDLSDSIGAKRGMA